MKKITLDQETLWKGVTYPSGEVNVPEELAVALGIEEPPPQTVSLEVESPPAESTSKKK